LAASEAEDRLLERSRHRRLLDPGCFASFRVSPGDFVAWIGSWTYVHAFTRDVTLRRVSTKHSRASKIARVGYTLLVTRITSELLRDLAESTRSRGCIRGGRDARARPMFRLAEGRLDEIVDRTDEVHGQHEQGGWSQARFQRHIEHLVHEHVDAIGGEIDGTVRRARTPQLVIVAPEELRSTITSKLSSEARESIVGWASVEAHAGPDELLATVQPIFEQVRVRREREQLERWREQLGRNGRAVSGWHETLCGRLGCARRAAAGEPHGRRHRLSLSRVLARGRRGRHVSAARARARARARAARRARPCGAPDPSAWRRRDQLQPGAGRPRRQSARCSGSDRLVRWSCARTTDLDCLRPSA
jgi:hypothetical protein